MGGSAAATEPESSGQSMQLLLSMNDFTNFKQIGKGKDCVVYAASCEKLGGHSVVLKVSCSSQQQGVLLILAQHRPQQPVEQAEGRGCCFRPSDVFGVLFAGV